MRKFICCASALAGILLKKVEASHGEWHTITCGRAMTRTAFALGADDRSVSTSDGRGLPVISVFDIGLSEAPCDAELSVVPYRKMSDDCMACSGANALHLVGEIDIAKLVHAKGTALALKSSCKEGSDPAWCGS